MGNERLDWSLLSILFASWFGEHYFLLNLSLLMLAQSLNKMFAFWMFEEMILTLRFMILPVDFTLEVALMDLTKDQIFRSSVVLMES